MATITAHYVKLLLASIVFFFVIRDGASMPKGPPFWAKAKAFGQDKFDGDIILNQDLLNSDLNRETRNILKDGDYLWAGGVVPYVIDSTFSNYPKERTMIYGAIDRVHSVSCVRFVERTEEKYYISFIRGSGCSSYVGCMKMDAQPVSIGSGCAYTATILHELLHVLGFFHTSSRYDRDNYVIVYKDNIKSGSEQNFFKYKFDQVQTYGAPYEMVSLMHPPRKAWSKNSHNTIEAKRGPSVVLGNRKGMTEIDIGQLNSLYKCVGYKGCYKWLGMQDGRIKDGQLSASSNVDYEEPHQARLHLTSSSKGNGAWCAESNSQGQWIKIDLVSPKNITGIATQGKVDPFQGGAWVTRYNFHYSLDGHQWKDYAVWVSSGLMGNFDETSVQYNSLPVPISARYIKIIPLRWHRNICMRIELYGCSA